jgi:hypothetical protein
MRPHLGGAAFILVEVMQMQMDARGYPRPRLRAQLGVRLRRPLHLLCTMKDSTRASDATRHGEADGG